MHAGLASGARPLRLATLRHGGVLGAEGALLGRPCAMSARVAHAGRSSRMLVLGAAGLAKMRATQPSLIDQLLAAAFACQQDVAFMLAWRTGPQLGCPWGAPYYDPRASPSLAEGTSVWGAAATPPTVRRGGQRPAGGVARVASEPIGATPADDDDARMVTSVARTPSDPLSGFGLESLEAGAGQPRYS